MTDRKIVNFRLQPQESDGLRILADLTGETQVDIIRRLIWGELERQKDAIDAYNKSMKEAKAKIKK